MSVIWQRQGPVLQDRSVEWLCAWLMLAWAVSLAFGGDVTSLPTFRGFRDHGLSASVWALAFGIVGGGRMAALAINGRWPRSATVRQLGAFAGVLVWSLIAVLIHGAHTAGTPWGPALFICGVLTVFELLSLRRAAFDGRYYQR